MVTSILKHIAHELMPHFQTYTTAPRQDL